MTYIVLEMQTTNNITAVVPPEAYTDLHEAEAKFHTILASAAVSTVEEHTACIITRDGRVVRTECYRHYPETPVEEEETNEEPSIN